MSTPDRTTPPKVIRVLAIEDSVPDAEMISEMLHEAREPAFSYSSVPRLRYGLAELREGAFDIVLLDLGLPDSQGIDAVVHLKKEFPGIPIIVLTGLKDEDIAIKALQTGAQDYLVKGRIESDLLIRSIRYAIERKRAIDELQNSEARFREVFAHAPIGMTIMDSAGRYLHVNESYCGIVGYSEQELMNPEMDFRRITHPDDLEYNLKQVSRLLDGAIPAFSIEKRYIRKDGDIVWVRINATVRRDAEGRPFQIVTLCEDINERKCLEEEIRHMAQHDSLTGLPNRRLFNEIISVEAAEARRNGKKLAIVFLDLDRFKEINDTLGHEAGDDLLKQTASRLKAVLRVSDTVARTGGDEFNVILPDIAHAEYAADVCGKILNEIRKPFTLSGHELNVSTSIGISVFPDDGEDIETLLRYADIAMYHAKEKGRNAYQFYNPIINTRSIERMRFENSLRRAIERNEFRLYFQPVVNIKSGKMVSAEALVRWQHPDRGLLEPRHFFASAQEIGFLPEMDEWVLKAATSYVKTWIDEGISPICITVNVSAREFQSPDLNDRIARILTETGLPPECLDVEISETTAMGNIKNTISRVDDLAGMGVHVSIDDFGTGYSSLNYLKRLPIQKLKIDKSFIDDIATNPDDRAIITAVLLMARAMKLTVVAEGVERMNQLTFLRAAGCDEAQGFLFSEPLPAEKFRELMSAAKEEKGATTALG